MKTVIVVFVLFCVIENYSVMFYNTKKPSAQDSYLYRFLFEKKINKSEALTV